MHPAQFVNYIQNHDQIANSGRGDRLLKNTSPGRYRAAAALLLLAPNTPMLFQGQEFGASSPFHYFADYNPELRKLVQEGRLKSLSQFPELAQPDMQAIQPEPGDRSTFERCKLNFSERERHAPVYKLHRDLLRLRREDPVFRSQQLKGVDGAVLGAEAFVLRFFEGPDATRGASSGQDRLLLINLGRDLELNPAPEPLLAPPEGMGWKLLWSSEDPSYGGSGTGPFEEDKSWSIPGHAAVVMTPCQK
jgi:maltooligosyltrehalose trehalohydrolase